MGPEALKDWLWARRAVAALLVRLQGLLREGKLL
jgi:hypothetical protein